MSVTDIATVLYSRPKVLERKFDDACTYDPSWVHKLYRAVHRNTTKPFRFHVLTDFHPSNFDDPIIVHPFVQQERGIWCWNEVFRPDLKLGQTMTFGLDTVICGSLDDLMTYSGPMCLHKTHFKKNGIGNGIAIFSPQTAARMWKKHNSTGTRARHSFRSKTGQRPASSTQFWARANPDRDLTDDLFPGQVASWMMYKAGAYHPSHGNIPIDRDNVRVVWFVRWQKPNRVTGPWADRLLEHWK